MATEGDYRLFRCNFSLVLFMIVLLFMIASGASLPDITVRCSKKNYSLNDTVILAVEVKVPEGYVMVGNPKGPGTGRPMNVWITSQDASIRWLEVRKPQAIKYGLPFGEWVWAYSGKTCFFCTGVISDTAMEDVVAGRLFLEYLICSNECRLVTRSVPFLLRISPVSVASEHFFSQVELFDQYRKTSPMMALEHRR